MSPASDRRRLALGEWSLALARLVEALALPVGHPLLIDGTIQRFEFSFELAWKCLKLTLAEQENLQSASPRQALQHAYALGWIDDEAAWVTMLQDRNLTSHTYREALAREIHARVPAHAAAMRALQLRIAQML